MIEFQELKIISWNTRGAVNSRAKSHVRELTRTYKPNIFCIMETYVLFSRVEIFWRRLGYYAIATQEAQGHSGGLQVLAKKENYTYQVLESQRQAITFKISLNRKEWACTSVYGSPIPIGRCQLWDYLKDLRSKITCP